MADPDISVDVLRDEAAEEGDVCRVCRVEGDDDDPLIYPCKCSGSVRYVHPSCFKSWLAHSQKQRCEICGHPYTFSKIYQSYIPSTIPFLVYLRQAGLFLQRIAYNVVRVELAILAWLVVLPSCNMFTLQGVVWMADQLPWSFTSVPSSGNSSHSEGALQALTNSSLVNSTSPASLQEQISQSRVVPRLMTGITILVERLFRLVTFAWVTYSEEEELSAVIRFLFRGQLLTIVLAAAVFGVMVLRTVLEENAFGRDFGPAHPESDEPVDPDEWIVRKGVAYKKDEAGMEELRKAEAPLQLDNKQREEVKKLVGVLKETRATTRTRKADVGKKRARKEKGKQGEGESPKQMPDILGQPDDSEDIVLPDDMSILAAVDSNPETPHYPTSTASIDISSAEDSDNIDIPRTVLRPLFQRPAWSIEVTASTSSSERNPSASAGDQAPPLPDSPLALLDDEIDQRPLLGSLPMTPPRPSPALQSPMGVEYRAPELIGEKDGEDEESLAASPFKGKGKERAPDSSDRGSNNGLSTNPYNDISSEAQEPSTESDPVEAEVTHTIPRPIGEIPEQLRAEVEEAIMLLADEGLEVQMEEGARPFPQLDIQVAEVDDHVDVEFAEEGDWMWDDAGGEGFWGPVMEIVGIVGPWANLIQNLMICIVIGSAATTLLVGIPLMIGKTLLAADFVRSFLYTGRLVIKGTRVVTDPLIDISTEILRDVVVRPALSSFHALEAIVADKLGLQGVLSSRISHLDASIFSLFAAPFQSGDNHGGSKSIDILALIGNRTYRAYQRYRSFGMTAAFSTNLASRLWCLAVGYVGFITTFGSITLLGELDGAEGELGRSIAFIKVAIFTILDAIILPFLLGCSIDFYTIPLFSGASIWTRIDWFRTAPGSAYFVHLFIGSTFTYYFVTMLLWIRGDIRRGALYWMLDPRDPKFSITKQLLEKSTWWSVQRRFSIVKQHLIVQFWLFGVWCWGLKLLGSSSVPELRLSVGPISSIPFDLLFIHLAIPPSIKALRLQRRLRFLWRYLFRRAVALFGLTDLVYGKRKVGQLPDITPPAWLETLWKPADFIYRTFVEIYDPIQGGSVRAPSSNVTFENLHGRKPDKRGAFIALDESGSPKSQEDKIRLLRQDRLTRSKARDPKKDFTVLEIPPYWLARVWALIYLTLISLGIGIGVVTLLPVVLGRAAFDILGVKQLHDGYSFFAGCYILYFIAKISRAVGKYVVKSRRAGVLYHSSASTWLKRSVMSWINKVYTFSILFGVLPVLTGLCIELHLGILVRYGLALSVKPVIHLWDAWANGLVSLSVMIGVVEMYSPRIVRNRNANATYARIWSLHNIYRRPSRQTAKEVTTAVLPLALWGMLYILVPASIAVSMALLNIVRPSSAIAYLGMSTEEYNSFMCKLLAVTPRHSFHRLYISYSPHRIPNFDYPNHASPCTVLAQETLDSSTTIHDR
ncbi:hypothetical protein BCR39DRAFT_532887 [Naematelia encephala]|uniref:RING-type E3 ubiquitin transferase n=1 Tax=Naematelia encephala TaxID=71784 RepID=A0A1Y2B4X7_9TREE|nr:hypothetical protein BCR39DRAFT_532887 [Naematelia encephala]